MLKQVTNYLKLPKNHIDDFEDEVVKFNRAGVITDARFLEGKLIRNIFDKKLTGGDSFSRIQTH